MSVRRFFFRKRSDEDLRREIAARANDPAMHRRTLLRPRPASEIQPHSTLDAGDVAEVESLIELVSACRNYASELAISEMTTTLTKGCFWLIDDRGSSKFSKWATTSSKPQR